jgi:hypothetical protein
MEINRPGREANKSTPPSAKVKKGDIFPLPCVSSWHIDQLNKQTENLKYHYFMFGRTC